MSATSPPDPGPSRGDSDADPTTSADPGWVHHAGTGDGSFTGWLYHYADGTMVDAAGIEYAFPEPTDPTSGDAEPVAEQAPEPAPEPAPAPEAEPEPEIEPEPESTPRPSSRPDLTLVAPPPDQERDEQPRETGDVVHAIPQASGPAPAHEPEQNPEEAPEEAPEQPATNETDEPVEEAEEPEEPVQERERPRDVPRFVEYTPTAVRAYLLGGVFVVAAVAAVLTAFVAISESSTAALVIASACGALGLVAWWALLGWRPTVVSIREGVLEIARGDHTETFELTSPTTSVEFRGRPGSPSWTAVVRHQNGPRTMLRPSQVKPRQFERIVRHYRPAAKAPEAGATSPTIEG